MKVTKELARELLSYNPETGILAWKNRSRRWFKSDKSWRTWNSRFSGKRAGYYVTRRGGYRCRCITISGRTKLEHHIVWMIMTDESIPKEIDHDNRDATDNRWSNLKASCRAENGKNISKRVTSTSGVTGVSWDRNSGKWCASGFCNGKRVYLGLFHDLDEAAMEAMEFREDNGYSRGHGMDIAKYHKQL